MLWMPPLPGWLGRAIDSVDGNRYHVRQTEARKRLRELGVAKGDLDKLYYEPEEWLGRLVKKYRDRKCRT